MLAALGTSLSPGSAAPLAKPHPAIPRTSPGEWITPADYPISSARRKETGVTGIRLTIDTDGFAQDCVVTQDSGNVLLDQTSCAIIRARAWFLPATDDNGAPMVGHWTTRITWRLPGTPDEHQKPEEAEEVAQAEAMERQLERFQQSFESFSSETAFIVHEDGRISDCEQRFVGAMAAQFTPFRCKTMPPAGVPFKDMDGIATAKRVVMRYSIDMTDPGTDGSTPGE
ncbi:energy transducer TonB [Sphingobium lactosutens]|uniref:energy transducer TonB n=1 Tax=Sphingobium lactosutens TaxID=522773 RepID=UPI0015BFBD60|nr:energy transducer TonB [Sphingobium lactosutens]